LVKDGAWGATGDELVGLRVESGGVVTHSARLLTGLTLNVAGALEVVSGGAIDVSGKGLRGGGDESAYDGFGESYDRFGAVLASGSGVGTSLGAGGSYGGRGADSGDGGLACSAYGFNSQPRHLGSGGGGFQPAHQPFAERHNAGGNGGGLVAINAAKITIDGHIAANGQQGMAGGGGGSGGSIRIVVDSLIGNGHLEATGAPSSYSAVYGAAGGGRIAIYAASSSLVAQNLSVSGGDPSSTQGRGTIYDATAGALITVTPHHGANVGLVTVLISGGDFTAVTGVQLRHPPMVVPAVLTLNPHDHYTMTASFDLTNQPEGPWDIDVFFANAPALHLHGAFTVEPLEDASVSTRIVGRSNYLQGRWQRYAFIATNTSNTDKQGALLAVLPPNASWHIESLNPPTATVHSRDAREGRIIEVTGCSIPAESASVVLVLSINISTVIPHGYTRLALKWVNNQ